MTTSVDFDYNGPPVTVSNAMAVQLVAEFGIRNAWFAFLKLRGMKLKNEEAANAHESFTYFRNKIGHLRRLAKEHKVDSEKQKDKNNEDFDLLFSADFDNFFVSSDSLELRKDAQQYSDIEDNELLEDNVTSSTSSIGETNSSLTTVSLLQVIEQNKKRQQNGDDNKQIFENVQNKKKISESEQFEEQKDDISVQGKNSQGKKISRTNKKTAENQETKQMVEKLLAAKEEIARRHAETIDDVVSVVMEKIRNNQPFEGELSAQSGHFIPPKSHHKRAGIGGSGQKLVHHRSAIMGQIKSDEIRQQQQGSTVLSSVPTEGILNSTPTTAFSHFSPGQSIVLLQNPLPSGGLIQIPQSQISFGGHSSTSLNSPPHKSRHTSYNGQLMGETPIHSQQQQFPISSPIYSPLQGTASRLQQQHQNIYTLSQPIITGDSSIGGGTTTTAIPLEMAIQQNMTVQELIQTLKVQGNRSTNTQIILQTNANLPSTPTPLTSSILSTNDLPIQNQQETPDSSSQEANIQETALSYLKKDKSENQIKKVRRKKKGENEQQTEKLNIEKTEAEFNLQEKQKITFPMSDNIIGQSQLIEKIKDKKPTTTNVNIPSDSSVNQKQNQRIDELESQLKKLNKQLLTERNKSATQKKRAEKALSDLEKASDSIQLLRIDLACQKTDNNTLISENIALKAENQQLRSKEKRSSGPSLLTGISKNRKRKEITAEPEMLTEKSGGRSRKSSLKTGLSSEKPQTPPPLSSELGRRQSKRICVTRNQFMRNFF